MLGLGLRKAKLGAPDGDFGVKYMKNFHSTGSDEAHGMILNKTKDVKLTFNS
jgi:hypothetical protein